MSQDLTFNKILSTIIDRGPFITTYSWEIKENLVEKVPDHSQAEDDEEMIIISYRLAGTDGVFHL